MVTKRIRMAVICPSEIAYRRFMPALVQMDEIEYIGIGVNSVEERYGSSLPDKTVQDEMIQRGKEKANKFAEEYGGIIFDSYYSVVTSDLVDAVYIPLPPSLHYKWAKIALECGKHVLVEKPSTLNGIDTKELINIAKRNELVIHENYMFVYHKQIDELEKIIKSGEIGDVRCYRVRFGFPRRDKNDFRYEKKLGGGALIDAAGYTMKYATRLLGESIHVSYARMNYIDEFEVDMFGSGVFSNDEGETVQIAYGMDNDYKCELEVWGSKGTLTSGRVFTSPAGYIPSAVISKNGLEKTIDLPTDDAFLRSIGMFISCIKDKNIREDHYIHILKQAELVDEFRKKAQ